MKLFIGVVTDKYDVPNNYTEERPCFFLKLMSGAP